MCSGEYTENKRLMCRLLLFLPLQVRPGPVPWTHTAPGEDLVPKQAHEVEENGERWCMMKGKNNYSVLYLSLGL